MEQYKPCQRLVETVHFQLQELEANVGDAAALKNDVSRNLNDLGRMIADVRASVAMQPVDRRTVWATRVKALTDEHDSLRDSLAKFLDSAHRRTAAERAELFARSDNGAHAVKIDALADEHASLKRSTTRVGEFIDQGIEVLGSLRKQRGTLKKAHKTVLDIMGSLGISRNLMNVIGRRTSMDKALVYGGMIFVLVVFYLAWKYL